MRHENSTCVLTLLALVSIAVAFVLLMQPTTRGSYTCVRCGNEIRIVSRLTLWGEKEERICLTAGPVTPECKHPAKRRGER